MPVNETISINSSLVRSTNLDRSVIRPFVLSKGSIKEEKSGVITLPTTSTPVEVALDLGGVDTAKFVYLETDQPITVLFNAAPLVNGVPVGTDGNDKPAAAIFVNCEVTEIEVVNQSGNEVSIYYFVAG